MSLFWHSVRACRRPDGIGRAAWWGMFALWLGLSFPAGAQQLHSPKGAELFGAQTTSVPVSRKQIRLQWEYPVEFQTTDLIFKLYHSTNLSQPLRLWPLLTNIPGDWRAVDVFAEHPREFFVLTASNAHGESDFATR